ncbi:MAG TPA: AAA-like domain-containing protein [Chthonomonadaceae bacterium]|nr:AAA-like domain-containing protein [Chthonomonadaceae bacterium]
MTTAEDRFYITGGTLPLDASSYVVRQADTQLLKSLKRGDFCYVLNTRQMGKSSLMIRTAQQLRDADGETRTYRTAVLDLTSVGQNLTVEQWYFGLVARIGTQIGLMDPLIDCWRENRSLGPMQRFMVVLRQALILIQGEAPQTPAALTLFVDEIDAVRSLPFSSDEFFAGIRECYNRRTLDPLFHQLTFCLLGVATPADLISDTRMSPFNIGERILLSDFTPEEAAPLAQGLSLPNPPEGLLSRILYWTNGHPYLTQRLCRALAEAMSDPASGIRTPTPESVDRLCEQLFLTKTARETDDNLAFVRNRLLRSEVDLASLLDMVTRIQKGRRVKDDETNPLSGVLRLSGVVRVEQGELKIRNRIYDQVFDKEWVAAHMPNAEVRRQQAAYRRGMLRAAAIGLLVVAAVAALATVAIMQANRAKQATASARKNLWIANGETARAERLAGQLSAELNKNEAARKALKQSLGEVDNQKRAVEQALTQARASEANAKTQEARAQTLAHVAQSAQADAQQQQALAITQWSKANVSQAMQDMDQGDRLGALLPLTTALEADRHDPRRSDMDRLRLAAALRTIPRLTQSIACGTPISQAAFSPDHRSVLTCDPEGTVQIWDLAMGKCLHRWPHSGAVTHAAFSRDGRRVVTTRMDGTAQIWTVAADRSLSLDLKSPRPIEYAAFNPQGNQVVTAGTGSTAIWDADTGHRILAISLPRAHDTFVDYSPDGSFVVVLSINFRAHLMDTHTGDLVMWLGECYSGRRAAFSPDGRHLAVAGTFGGTGANRGAYLFDLTALYNPKHAAAAPRYLPHSKVADDVNYSPDGRSILTASEDYTAGVWSAADGAPIPPFQEHPIRHSAAVSSAEFSPEGQRILTVSDDVAQLWDAATGARKGSLLRHPGHIVAATFDRQGDQVIIVGSDGILRSWDVRSSSHSQLLVQAPATGGMQSEFLRNGTRLLTLTPGNPQNTFTIALWDTADGRKLFTVDGQLAHDLYYFLSEETSVLSKDQTRIVLYSHKTIQVRNLVTGEKVSEVAFPADGPVGARISPDGALFVARRPDRTLQVYSAATGAPFGEPFGEESTDWTFSPDSKHIAVLSALPEDLASLAHRARVWDLTIHRASPAITYAEQILATWFAPDGRLLFTSTWNDSSVHVSGVETGKPLSSINIQRTVEPRLVPYIVYSPRHDRALITGAGNHPNTLWDLHTGKPLSQAHPSIVDALRTAVSPDGRLFITIGPEPRIWDTWTGEVVTALKTHGIGIRTAVFSRDGRRVLTSSESVSAQIWDTRTGEAITPPMLHSDVVRSAIFSPDERCVVTASEDGTARVWDAETGEPVTPPLPLIGQVQRADFTPDGRSLLTITESEIRRWNFTPETRPLADLVQQAQLLSGRRMDPAVGPVAAAPTHLQADWNALRAKYPNDFKPFGE